MDTIQPSDLRVEEKTPYTVEQPLTRGQRVKRWFRKYFLEGQHLDDEAAMNLANLPPNPSIHDLIFIKYRKFIAVFIPLILIHIFWWAAAIRHNFFKWYPEYWPMPLTMVLGSFVGGITSEGSGAVAFPVMTLALHIDPDVARDFSIMIQSIGMTSALTCVLFMKVKFEYRAVILGTLGCIPGFIIGVQFVDPHFTGMQKKMIFVSIWTSFAISLMILNFQKKRPTFKEIPEFNWWKAVILVLTGFVGGLFDSLAGSGIDIAIFSMITLLFRLTEKTATPTTVILKGINASIGFFYRAVMNGDIDKLAWRSFAISVPVSSIAGPVGSFVGSHLHRQVVAFFVYVLELVSLIGFLVNKPSWELVAIGGCIIFGGFVFFSIVSKCGKMMLERIERRQAKARQEGHLEE